MRLERNTAFAHILWVAPIQIAIGVGLLLHNLGYSALVGLGVLILGFPVQMICVAVMFKQRKKAVVLTDKRVRTITEVLQGIRLIKYYAWEEFFARQIAEIRENEVSRVRRFGFARANLISAVTVIPTLASVLSFITYSLSGHDLNVSIIFSSLQLFNIIRAPLMFLPMVLAGSSDAVVALGRISKFLVAEELDDPYIIDPSSKFAIDVNGDFTWETAHKPTADDAKAGKGGPGGKKEKKTEDKAEKRSFFSRKKKADDPILPVSGQPGGGKENDSDAANDEKPFELKDLNFKVPSGSFIAIVGPIGSGKVRGDHSLPSFFS